MARVQSAERFGGSAINMLLLRSNNKETWQGNFYASACPIGKTLSCARSDYMS